jgi:hypothetical protein
LGIAECDGDEHEFLTAVEAQGLTVHLLSERLDADDSFQTHLVLQSM